MPTGCLVRLELPLAAALFVLVGLSAGVEAAPVSVGVVVIDVVETGAAAPGATYLVTVTGSDFSTSVSGVAGQLRSSSGSSPGSLRALW